MPHHPWTTRGILNPQSGETHFDLRRHEPAPDLRFFIAHYWIIRWNLETPYSQEVLPYPSVHAVFESGNSRVYGVVSGKFIRQIAGQGMVFGLKFRPGAFHPFWHLPVAGLTDRSIDVREVFGAEAGSLETAILNGRTDEAMIGLVEEFLRARLPDADPRIPQINAIVDAVAADRRILKVEDVADRFGLHPRTLQRLFNQYVGVSPKWVIQRYRLHEAAEQVADDAAANWAKLAQDLGYFDQAHFIRDFKAMIGSTPAEYARQTHPDSPLS